MMTFSSVSSTLRAYTGSVNVTAGVLAGLLAGAAYGLLLNSQGLSPMGSEAALSNEMLFHLVISLLAGAGFALMFGGLIRTLGSGVICGVLFAVLWWLIGPLSLFPPLYDARPAWTLNAARAAFPLLVGLSLSSGAIMGGLYVIFRSLVPWRGWQIRQRLSTLLRNAISGGLAGLLGGLVFGTWMAQVGMFPLIAGLLGTDVTEVGQMLHFVISVVIGIMYGVLFRSDIYSVGTSIAWGATYGLIWWMLGPLTLMPWLLGQGLQWNLEAAQSAFPSLIGHVIYGVVLALAYSLLNQIWRTLFVDSDPLLREPEGPGTRSLRALGTGMMASVLGGLLFTVVMMATDALPLIAQLVGLASTMAGFVVHMVISSIIGATYGLLFQKEVLKPSQALGWGLIYGLIWWFVGPLTLMPVLLGEPLQWSIAAAQINFPSLIGHLVYGVALGLGHYHLLRQYKPRVNKKRRKQSAHDIQTAAGVSAALCVTLTLLVLILVPVLTAA
jgi:uncharacterized membrane protein YagU involved in acid resistance